MTPLVPQPAGGPWPIPPARAGSLIPRTLLRKTLQLHRRTIAWLRSLGRICLKVVLCAAIVLIPWLPAY